MPRLRPASDSDRNYVFRLYEELFRSHIEQIWGWDDDWQSSNFEAEWNQIENQIVEHNGVDVGYLQTQLKTDPDHLYVIIIAIDPKYQGNRIGSSVMRDLIQRAKKLGIPLRLNVFRTNPEALRFYVRLGFREVTTTESGVMLEWHRDGSTNKSKGEQIGSPNEKQRDKPAVS